MVRQAVILCGGLGSRLGALAAETPKPLLPVDGGPFFDILLFELARHGVTRGFAAGRVCSTARCRVRGVDPTEGALRSGDRGVDRAPAGRYRRRGVACS